MNIFTLSNYIVDRFSSESPDGITPMKLQKLLYYVKVWTLVANHPQVQEDFEHWNYGPVNRMIYEHYIEFGNRPIPPNRPVSLKTNQFELKLIDFIIENYIIFDAFTLSAMTHLEEPWQVTQRNQIISNELIKTYFSKHQFAKNFQPFDLDSNPFFPLEGYSFTVDMTKEDAQEITMYSSYQEYKQLLGQAEQEFNEKWLQSKFISF